MLNATDKAHDKHEHCSCLFKRAHSSARSSTGSSQSRRRSFGDSPASSLLIFIAGGAVDYVCVAAPECELTSFCQPMRRRDMEHKEVRASRIGKGRKKG